MQFKNLIVYVYYVVAAEREANMINVEELTDVSIDRWLKKRQKMNADGENLQNITPTTSVDNDVPAGLPDCLKHVACLPPSLIPPGADHSPSLPLEWG